MLVSLAPSFYSQVKSSNCTHKPANLVDDGSAYLLLVKAESLSHRNAAIRNSCGRSPSLSEHTTIMTLTHVVLLKWKPGTPYSAVEPGLKKLGQIPLTETYILSYRIGKDLALGRTLTNHDIAVVAEFATEED